MQKAIQEIISEAAKEFNLPKQVIEEIYLSQVKFTRDKIKTSQDEDNPNKLPTVMWPKFGRFYANHKRIFAINQNREKYEQKKE